MSSPTVLATDKIILAQSGYCWKRKSVLDWKKIVEKEQIDAKEINFITDPTQENDERIFP